MSVKLQKNGKINLSKAGQSLEHVVVAMGWDVNTHKNGGEKPKGLFKSLLGSGESGGSDYDLDASIKICKDSERPEIVYYGHLKDSTGHIVHGGDNLTGAGDGDDESIKINLNSLPASINRLVVGANIYQAHSRHQDFGQVENAFLRIYNADNNVEIVRYDLTNEFAGMTAVIFGELVRTSGDWEFKATGIGMDAKDISEMFR